jgi:hypothetical protein
VLLFGMIEVGGVLKAYSTTANAVRAGGRMASVAGADPMADRMILERVAQELAGTPRGRIALVVVWHSTGPGDRVPAECVPVDLAHPNLVSLGVSDDGVDAIGACNVYVRPAVTGGAFDIAMGLTPEPPEAWFGCEGPMDPTADQKLDCNWPGKNRRAITTPRGSSGPIVGPDFIGVHLQVDHHVTDIVLDQMEIRDAAVNLIEPHGYEL